MSLGLPLEAATSNAVPNRAYLHMIHLYMNEWQCEVQTKTSQWVLRLGVVPKHALRSEKCRSKAPAIRKAEQPAAAMNRQQRDPCAHPLVAASGWMSKAPANGLQQIAGYVAVL